jgi:hypothetical protein
VRHLKLIAAALAATLLICSPGSAGDPPDRLSEALSAWGLTRADLGAHPKGYWTRFPLPERVPHLLASFPDLFAEPLKLYDYGRIMANAADTYLDTNQADTPSVLLNLVYFLGVDQRVGGFRNYSANLIDSLPGSEPLRNALQRLWSRADLPIEYRAFGTRADWSGMPDSVIIRFVHAVRPELRYPLAVFVANLDDAIGWWQVAVRHIEPQLAMRLYEIDDLADTQGDGTRYYPELDDIAAVLDEQSLYYACMKVATACDRLGRDLRDLGPLPSRTDEATAELDTPFGRIVVGTSGTDTFEGPALGIIDPGGDDHYVGPVGASIGAGRPFGIVVDAGGNDEYASDAPHAQGAGILGCGVLYDRAGNDRYAAGDQAQGFGLFGLGLVYDRSGDDRFDMHYSGQGCGYFGIGLLLDGGGRDEYRLWAEGQGQGGIGGGVGVLATRGGDDLYYAEPDAAKAGRADYHSDYKIAANNAQGSGNGRRGDGADGHSWAGGLGVLIDLSGNDRYESGNWSQGIGYWFGTGILYDREGDDVYRSVYFTQASGAHFCNAALIDEAGNDRHELTYNKGAAIAFGWDYTNALLIDKGGNDYYGGGQSCLGLSTGRSTVLLYDANGDDEYRLDTGKAGMGEASPRDDFFAPSPVSPYMFYSRSVGLLLDTGGRDRYLRVDDVGGTTADTLARDGAAWSNPSTQAGNLFGGGRDSDDGVVPDFQLWDAP